MPELPGFETRAADWLGRVKRKTVVAALIDAMADADESVRQAAWASFYALTDHRPVGYVPSGSATDRQKALDALRQWWEANGKSLDLPR